MSAFNRFSGLRRAVLLAAVLALAAIAGVALMLALSAQPTVAQTGDSETGWISGYVKFDTILGESPAAGHEQWCELLSFDQVLVASNGASSGRAATRATFADILLVKHLDRASPQLQNAVASGKVLPKVWIDVARNAGENQVVFYSYELTNARITSYNIGTTGQRDLTEGLPRVELGGPTLVSEFPYEEVSVAYERIKVSYTVFDVEGNPAGTVEFQWDVSANKAY
jgi:type VI secretion system secreted protein Hcp